MSDKLKFEDFVKEHFEQLTKDVWTSIYEKVEIGFAASDLSHYYSDDLNKAYAKYLKDDEDFLDYKDE